MSEFEPTRILYMEDEPGLARLLKKHLGRKGFEVEIAPDGETGLAMVAAHAYHILLVDYNMPGMSGLDVIWALAEGESFPPTIMVTGGGNERIAVEAMKLGATDYLVKDVEMGYLELLPIIIEQVLEKQRMVAERNQMIARIQENEERYRRLVELSPEGIAVAIEGRFEFVNPAGVQLLGAGNASELLGRKITDCVQEETRISFENYLQKMADGAENVPWAEERFLRLDGKVLDVEVSGIPFYTMGDNAVQILFRDITDRKLAAQRLEQLAHFDPLTGLPNRTLFFDRLDQAFLQAKRYKNTLALLYVDLDRFKEVNDSLGHDIGDLVLKEVAERMRNAVRLCDTVARMGGDEFTIILTRVNEGPNAAIVAEKIIAALQKPIMAGGFECSVGASVGISTFPDEGDSAATLLKKADTAMYLAKKQGRSRYCFYVE